jgi:hypothetical protein
VPKANLNANHLIPSHHVLFITLDTLRYDVAVRELEQGRTPTLQRVLPPSGWEQCHSPGSFTYAAHHAFFSGFLPTPAHPGPHPRLLAAQFPGAATITDRTYVFEEDTIVEGFHNLGYYTICIGGVGFFNRLSPLGSVFPNLFDISYWSESLGVTDPHSTHHQVALVRSILSDLPRHQSIFLFVNISAIHQPNYFYLNDSGVDTLESHAAALRYVDQELHPLFEMLRSRGSWLSIICSDHGTCYGEDGYVGHRLAHPVVWTVPYAEFILPGERDVH